MLLMIDNYDSFTYNLVQYFQRLDQDVLVKRNDELSIAQIKQLNPQHIVLSPGPCTPNEAGISLEVIKTFAGKIPILGICLGHQSIGQAFGGDIIRATQVMHGKTSSIYHDGKGIFAELPNPFRATRYHSLVVSQTTLPDCLEVTAWTDSDDQDYEIMGLRHKSMDIEGVQFHPESIMTQAGHQLLDNFLNRTTDGH